MIYELHFKEMNKKNFLETMEDYGINLDAIGIHIGPPHAGKYAICASWKDDGWAIYVTDEGGKMDEAFRGSETDAFGLLYECVKSRLKEYGYVNPSVSMDVIFTPKSDVLRFLETGCDLDDWELDGTWDYLRQDMHILNEVKYYARHRRFVPDSDAYAVEGYTAQKIYRMTSLDAAGAYNYLAYMCRKPAEAIENLYHNCSRKAA